MTKQEIESQLAAANRKYEEFSQRIPNSVAVEKIKEKRDRLQAMLDDMSKKESPTPATEAKKRGRRAKEKTPTTAKKRGRPAKSAKPTEEKISRFVFEQEVDGGKNVEVIFAASRDSAMEMAEDGYVFVREITRGRSPKTGFLPDESKPTKAAASTERKKRGRPSKKISADEAGISEEDSKKRSKKVESRKTKGRGRPKSTRFFLFEMPLKTSGKFKRKVQAASSVETAKNRIGENYVFVKEVTADKGAGTFETSLVGTEKTTAAMPTLKAQKVSERKKEAVKTARKAEQSTVQLTQSEVKVLKALAQALMKAKFEKGGMTSDDWDEMFENLPVLRTQFEEETFEFEDGGTV